MPAVPSSIAPHHRRTRGVALLIFAAILAAYSSSLLASLDFSSGPGLPENAVTSPPVPASFAAPLLDAARSLERTFIADHLRLARALTLGVHFAAALLLFGIVRRTLAHGIVPASLRNDAFPLAVVVALLWSIHPLHTAALTGDARPVEFLGNLLHLLALYSLIRGAGASPDASRRWLLLPVISCVVGVTFDATLVFAPVLLFLFDRAFIAGNFRETWRQRKILYAACALSFFVFAILATPTNGLSTATLSRNIANWTLFFSQCEAFATYLRLALWPAPLIFDYGARFESDFRLILPEAIVLGPLLIATAHALVRRPPAGFLGAVFFLLLLPASGLASIVYAPISEPRMYLPLAAVIVALVILAHHAAPRALLPTCGLLAVVLASATFARNHDYRSALALWSDTIAKRPDNPRAYYQLGHAQLADRNPDAAIASFADAIRLNPTFAEGHRDLAVALIASNPTTDLRLAQARRHARAAVQLNPNSSSAHLVLARVLLARGEISEATASFEQVLNLDPGNIPATDALSAPPR